MDDFLTCAICFQEMTRTLMTPCGHNFCEECIKDSVSIHKKCPLCNLKIADSSLLIRNHHLDAMIAKLAETREKGEADLLARALGAAMSSAPARVSPIASAFASAMKGSLTRFEKYYLKLRLRLLCL